MTCAFCSSPGAELFEYRDEVWIPCHFECAMDFGRAEAEDARIDDLILAGRKAK